MSTLPEPPQPAFIVASQQVFQTGSASPNPFDTPPLSRSGSPTLQLNHPALEIASDPAHLWDQIESQVPSRENSPGSQSRNSSWARSGSRSKDPLFKKSRSDKQLLSGSNGTLWDRITFRSTFSKTKEEPNTGRGRTRGNRGSHAERQISDTISQSASMINPGWRQLWMTRERAQLWVAFMMVGLVGMNDSATGANLSSMQAFYEVSYDKISLVFLSNVAGYFISCLSSSFLTHHLGLQWALILAATNMAVGCIILTLAPPFIIFVCSLALLGFGGGLYDACLTTVVSHEEDGLLMSMMYACFGVGAMFSPLIIGSFVDHGISWNKYYYLPFGISVALVPAGVFAFSTYQPPTDEANLTSTESADIPLTTLSSRQAPSITASRTDTRNVGASNDKIVHGRAIMSVQTRMKRALGLKVVWVGFGLIVISFASLDTLGAWMVSFMVEVRGSGEGAGRYQLSGLWGGIATGRVALAFLGRRIGERTFSILMLTLASLCLGVVWAVKSVPADAVALVLVGFFLGPVTPKILSVVSVRIPPSLKSSVMSLTIGLGLIGSSAGPLIFGTVAGKGGLNTLPAVLIGACSIASFGWLLLPKNKRRED